MNCRKAFYEKGNLKTHLRLHTGERPYVCYVEGCNAGYATQGRLNDHYQKVHVLKQIDDTGRPTFVTKQDVLNRVNELINK